MERILLHLYLSIIKLTIYKVTVYSYKCISKSFKILKKKKVEVNNYLLMGTTQHTIN